MATEQDSNIAFGELSFKRALGLPRIDSKCTAGVRKVCPTGISLKTLRGEVDNEHHTAMPRAPLRTIGIL